MARNSSNARHANGQKSKHALADNFRVSLSNLLIGANPVERRNASSPSKRDVKPGPTDSASSVDEWRVKVDVASSSEAQSAPAESSRDGGDTSSADKSQPKFNETSESEGISISVRSSGEPNSTSNDESSISAQKKNKNKRVKNIQQKGSGGATSSEQETSGADLTSSGDSCYDTSSSENRQPEGKSKKQAKPQKSKWANESGNTESSAPVSSSLLASSDLACRDSTGASASGVESSLEPNADSSKERGAASSGETTDGDDSGWSISDDCALRGMKEANDGLSWVDIGKSLNRGKHEVRARWKIIKDRPQGNMSSGDETSQSKDDSLGLQSALDRQTEDSYRQKRKASGKVSKKQGPDQTNRQTGKQGNQKQAASKKAAKLKAKSPQKTHLASLSGEEASSESNCDPHSQAWDPAEEQRQSDRYYQDYILPELYPPMIQPRPSVGFDEQDCAVLASVDSKYKRSKWLEMQANFYNVTGRMVPLEVIRDKCEEAEQEERKKVAHRKGVDGRKKVEKWVNNIASDYDEGSG